ncbi:MAG: amylo-alpha-1,6-glucosidase [Planctomycetota bacterium]
MSPLRILVVSPDGPEAEALERGLGLRLPFERQAALPSSFEGQDLVWIHAGLEAAQVPVGGATRVPGTLEAGALAAWVRGGGCLLLTGQVAAWTGPLGFEARPPRVERRTLEGPCSSEDRLGVAPFLEHPLFGRFPGGVYLRRPFPGCTVEGAFYRAGERPRDGRLLGVEKVHLGLEASVGLLTEHEPGEGRVLSLGAHLVFGNESPVLDLFEEARLRFAADMLEYLLAPEPGGLAWPEETREEPLFLPASLADPAIAAPPELTVPGGLVAAPGQAACFDLAARNGMLCLGRQEAGVQEIWRLPYRFFRDVSWSFSRNEHSPAEPEGVQACLRVTPWAAERELRGPNGLDLVETWAGGKDAGGLRGRLWNRSEQSVRVGLGFSGDHRLMWPYPAGVLGRLELATSRDGRLLRVRDGVVGATACWGFTVDPLSGQPRLVPEGSGFQARYDFFLEAGQALDWWIAAAPSAAEAEALLEGMLAGSSDPAREARAFAGRRRGLQVELGDPRRDEELAFARARGADCFMRVRTRAGGRELQGLVAGYDTTRPGWCSGRPGYAWFFGRDSLWCSRALLAFGDRHEVLENLKLLASMQDCSGQIYHELTAAGLAHFDAADATPMFVDMLGRYLAWTGDLETAEQLFPHVERALAFVQGADRDGDGVTENSDVGHGWMEGGPLREGVHAELYLAAFQAAALEAGAAIAERLGRPEPGWRAGAAAVQQVLNERFYEDGSFAHALRPDGSFDRSRTVFGVLPLLLDLAEPARGASLMEPFGSASFTSDWGLRILERSDPRYDPGSYQAGSVWPLFSGWVILADFLTGRPDSAWERLCSLLGMLRDFSPGVLEEVWHGDEYRPIGVTAHQAWSHAAVLGPLVEGLLGARPALGEEKLVLAPCLPDALDGVRFRGLSYLDLSLDMRLERAADRGSVALGLACSGRGRAVLDLGLFFPDPRGWAESSKASGRSTSKRRSSATGSGSGSGSRSWKRTAPASCASRCGPT